MKRIKGVPTKMLEALNEAATRHNIDIFSGRTVRESMGAISHDAMIALFTEIDATIQEAGMILDSPLEECKKCGGCNV